MQIFKIIVLAMFVLSAAGSCARTETGGKGGAKPGGGPAAGRNEAPAVSGPVFRCTSPGRWFSADPDELRKTVDGYLEKADKPKINGRIVALISPHAGYQVLRPCRRLCL